MSERDAYRSKKPEDEEFGFLSEEAPSAEPIPYEDIPSFEEAFPERPPEPSVPPELRADAIARAIPKAPDPAARRRQMLAAALKRDRQRQDQENTRAYLLAAGRREAPHLRNLGNQEAAGVQAQLAMEPKAVDPIERELMAFKVQKARMEAQPKPVDPQEAYFKSLRVRKAEQDLEPRPEKGVEYLTPAEQVSLESQLAMAAGMPVKLPRDEQGRTRKDFVGPLNSSANMMGMGGMKDDIAGKSRSLTRELADRREVEDHEKAQAGMEIPGWVRDPGVRVDEPDVRMLRDATAQTQTMQSSLDKLEGIYRKHGNTKLPSAERAAVKSLVTDLKMQAKGPAMYQLGVLSAQDDQLLSQVIPDPASGGGTLSDFFSGGENTLSKISTLRGQVTDRLNAKMGSRGYKARNAPRSVIIVDPETQAIKVVTEAQLEALQENRRKKGRPAYQWKAADE